MSIVERLGGLEVEVGDLLDSRQRAGRRDWSAYEDDPVGWARDVLGFEPWSRQEEILRSVVENPLTVVRGANGVGKDAVTFGPVILHHVFVRGGMVVAIAPTERQVVEIGMSRELRRWWRAGRLEGELFRSALRVGDRGVLAFTSNEVSRLTGFHHERLLVVLTECQGLDAFVWEAALACCVGDEDRIVALGNPIVTGGTFYQVSKPGSGWHGISMPAREHPNVAEGRTVIPGGVSRAGIERLASTYGTGSATYQARVEAEFPDEGEESLFRRSWLELAAERHTSGFFAVEAANSMPLLSVDPARYGPDSTAVAVRRGPVLQRIVTWQGADTVETQEKVEQLAIEEGLRPHGNGFGACGQIIVDVVGLGSGVLDQLKARHWNVHAYSGGSFTTRRDRERFLNERAKSHWRLRKLLEEGRIALPLDEILFDELLAVSWRPTGKDQIQIEAKKELKSKLGRSPDRGDAVVMAFCDAGQSRRPRVVKVRM
jgi:hypothetical protein